MPIYSNPNANKPIVLFGEEADMFLENNGIFLFEDCVVLEGEQAEAYKKRKAAEKAKAEAEEEQYMKNRTRTGFKHDKNNPNDVERWRRAMDITNNEHNKRVYDWRNNGSDANTRTGNRKAKFTSRDAVDRRLRRDERTGKKTFSEDLPFIF